MNIENVVLVRVHCNIVLLTFDPVIKIYATVLKKIDERSWIVRNSAYLWELIDCYPEGVVVAREHEGKIL